MWNVSRWKGEMLGCLRVQSRLCGAQWRSALEAVMDADQDPQCLPSVKSLANDQLEVARSLMVRAQRVVEDWEKVDSHESYVAFVERWCDVDGRERR